VIEGTLVNLRAREVADAGRNARWWADAEILSFMGDRYQRSSANSEAFTRTQSETPMSFEHGCAFAIDTKDGVHIGGMRLFDISPEERSASLAIMIGERAYWSKGYGNDALRTLLRFAFDAMNLRRIELTVFDYNPRAIAAYRKCGFVEEVRWRQGHYARGAFHDVLVMSVLRDEWRP